MLALGQIETRQDKPSLKLPLVGGLSVIAVVFVGFFGWAGFAPLDSAAVAPGFVTVASNRKTVQHLEGGIVRSLHVLEGEHVKQGAVLLKLEDTQAKATLSLLEGRRFEAMALRDRLMAERDWYDEIHFSDELSSVKAQQAVGNQQRIFLTRKDTLYNQMAIIEQSVVQYENEIKGLEAQRSAQTTQLSLTREELKDKKGLVKRGLAKKPQLLELQRQVAELRGKIGEIEAKIARANQSIFEAKLRVEELRANRVAEAAAQLRDSMSELQDLDERLGAARDVVERTTVLAPRDGVVVNLAHHTLGGVVNPGDTILEIVPSDDKLVIEASISPADIDVVSVGQKAQVRLTAYSQRTNVPLEGELISLSADGITNEKSGETFYKARVALREEKADMPLKPGMQAEVLVVTGERTLLNYLISPLQQSVSRSLIES